MWRWSETSQQRDPQKAVDSYETPAHPRAVTVSWEFIFPALCLERSEMMIHSLSETRGKASKGKACHASSLTANFWPPSVEGGERLNQERTLMFCLNFVLSKIEPSKIVATWFVSLLNLQIQWFHTKLKYSIFFFKKSNILRQRIRKGLEHLFVHSGITKALPFQRKVAGRLWGFVFCHDYNYI